MLGTSIISKFEHESTAAKRSLIAAFLFPLPYFITAFIQFNAQEIIGLILVAIPALTGLLFLIPIKNLNPPKDSIPLYKYDERNIMFSRNELEPGTERFKEYYSKNPDKKNIDDQFRAQPGLNSLDALFSDPVLNKSFEASFWGCNHLHDVLDGSIEENKISMNPNDISEYIKKWIINSGAHSAGITKLEEYHKYSTCGRGKNYGKPVSLSHKYAIALTVEMNFPMVSHAPKAPIIIESANQYSISATIAVKLAYFLRSLGYPARAHINAAYEVICPLVARDAGLGEIGRMGLLMTPKLGPRARIAVVTTDLPLVSDKRIFDSTIIEFCRICKKCSNNCPSQAIPSEDRKVTNNVTRWEINHEKCFTYWCRVGTDCGRCMSVCPYSHPNHFPHNIIRFFIGHSLPFRYFAFWMDNVLYGKKPKIKDLKKWQKVRIV